MVDLHYCICRALSGRDRSYHSPARYGKFTHHEAAHRVIPGSDAYRPRLAYFSRGNRPAGPRNRS